MLQGEQTEDGTVTQREVGQGQTEIMCNETESFLLSVCWESSAKRSGLQCDAQTPLTLKCSMRLDEKLHRIFTCLS
jgi:hypothetical protein